MHDHRFQFFPNPRFETLGPNGETWISHDKGVSSCLMDFGNGEIQVSTLHMIPFRKFGVDPLEEAHRNLRENIEVAIRPQANLFLLQGDFNFNDASLKAFLPGLFVDEISEVLLEEPTTPKGRKYDHVVYRGLKHVRSEVITNVLTDHFPVYSEFEIA